MQIIRRHLAIDLPPWRSAFLWGPRKVGKTYWLHHHFAVVGDAHAVRRAIVVRTEAEWRPHDSDIAILPWQAFLDELWAGALTASREPGTKKVTASGPGKTGGAAGGVENVVQRALKAGDECGDGPQAGAGVCGVLRRGRTRREGGRYSARQGGETWLTRMRREARLAGV